MKATFCGRTISIDLNDCGTSQDHDERPVADSVSTGMPPARHSSGGTTDG